MDLEWTDEWPNEAGSYWFYGWNHFTGDTQRWGKPRMYLIEVQDDPCWGEMCYRYLVGESVIDDQRWLDGKWAKAVLPDPPELD